MPAPVTRKKHPPRTSAFSPVEQEQLEVLDSAGNPLLVMPRETVLRQRLPYKVALVALRDQNGGIYLHKRSGARTRRPGLWGLSAAGVVLAGEAREDAARRNLAEELRIRDADLRVLACLPPSEETGHAELTLFTAERPASSLFRDPLAGEGGMYVDQDELEALARDLPHLLTPALHCVIAAGVLFDGGEKKQKRAAAADGA